MERETAMKILKELHDNSLFSNRIALETLIPELADSNDERIRKALIRFHKSTIDIDGIKGDRIVAWLEKQGESYTKKDVDDAYLKGICDAKHELEKQDEQKPILDFKASNFYVSKVDGKIHDMTYNPADKVEPFDKYEGLTDFERTLADICIGWIGEELGWKQYIKDNADVLLKIAIKKFNSIQDAPFKQKPAAWSEEDEENLQHCCMAISADGLHTYEDKQEMEAWLKSLKDRVQPKQVCGVEDEKHILSIEQVLNCADLLNVVPEKINVLKDWLKSLKDRIGE